MKNNTGFEMKTALHNLPNYFLQARRIVKRARVLPEVLAMLVCLSSSGGDEGSQSQRSFLLDVRVMPTNSATITLDPMPAPDGRYREGTVVTIRATPAGNFRILAWHGDLEGTSNLVQLTMNRNVAATVTMGVPPRPPSKLRVSAVDSVTPSPDASLSTPSVKSVTPFWITPEQSSRRPVAQANKG